MNKNDKTIQDNVGSISFPVNYYNFNTNVFKLPFIGAISSIGTVLQDEPGEPLLRS